MSREAFEDMCSEYTGLNVTATFYRQRQHEGTSVIKSKTRLHMFEGGPNERDLFSAGMEILICVENEDMPSENMRSPSHRTRSSTPWTSRLSDGRAGCNVM